MCLVYSALNHQNENVMSSCGENDSIMSSVAIEIEDHDDQFGQKPKLRFLKVHEQRLIFLSFRVLTKYTQNS
jgi:hypothetical protein